ncbi:MAG: LacI family DNA-binding transcriptional regulator [Anaerolineales bacterium]|nr:LacI family DNA-binding transcriptional regulator [Anaerolineales bacterium]MCB9144390.1 LacI family DNA-binding transcriptional regulator [Anaerolineales bacterium]
MKKITIRDVARKTGLSITTVSRALDGYDDVAEETRATVVSTAQKMGYIPNRAARQLRRQQAETIGYIIPVHTVGFADPFFSEFIAGLGDEISSQNYDLLVTSAPPASEEERTQYTRWIQSGKVDGIIVNRVRLQDWRLQYLARTKTPHVSMERSLDPINFIGIETDVTSGMLELITHLTNAGHKRIAYIGGDSQLKIEQDRFQAYLAGLSAAHLSFRPEMTTQADLTSEGGYQSAIRLLSQSKPPTAIVCINDLTAIGAMHACHDHHLKVGHDIAVAGFDGIADTAHTQPPLTTLDQPVYDIARQLVRMLLSMIHNETLSEKQVMVKPNLLIRASTNG